MKLISTEETTDFSLVLGGPLFQLYRRLHLSGDALEFLCRRAVVIALFVWLPLLLLSLLEGHALGGVIEIPFLRDVEANARFLIALPALIIAEVLVNIRISPLPRRFVDRRIVVGDDLPVFNAAVNSALRVRNSCAGEFALLVLVYTLGTWIWWTQIAMQTPTWYATPKAAHLNLTLAGYWYVFVSIPLFQFLLLRWYMRLVIWFRLLWQISNLNLRLRAAHPDRAGGIGFLRTSSYAFTPLLFAQGTLLSGLIASRVLHEGRNLLFFKAEAAGCVAIFVFCILGPLLMYTEQLDRTKRKGAAEYGLLGNRYVFRFEEKWLHSTAPETSELLGTPDIQSLSDLANSYSVAHSMRIVLFGLDDITKLAAVTAAPVLPLMLTMFSLGEILTYLMKVLF
jgi:hypothetical protein